MEKDYEKHQRVVAIREVGYGDERTAKGTKGVVVDVNSHIFSSTDYDVMFDTGVIVNNVEGRHLYPEAGAPARS